MRISSVLIFIVLCLYACADSSKELSGQEIYKGRCMACHGADGRMGMNGAKDLPSSPLTVKQRVSVVADGRKNNAFLQSCNEYGTNKSSG